MSGSGRSTREGIGYPPQNSWASLVAQLVKNLRPGFGPWVGKIPWRRERLPTPVFWPGEFHGLYSPWSCKELDMTKRLAVSFSFQYPCLENPMARGACQAIVHGVAKSQTRLNNGTTMWRL